MEMRRLGRWYVLLLIGTEPPLLMLERHTLCGYVHHDCTFVRFHARAREDAVGAGKPDRKNTH